MDQSVGYSVLVVDNDERSLAKLVKILIGWKYKVLTANSAHNALETLREFEGFFDIIITEFHMPGMDGFKFQKCIKDEFNLPIIMISKDNRKDIISKSLKNGVALFILKPFCANDFKDIWRYATTSGNEKSILANDLGSGEGEAKSENVVTQDGNNSLPTSSQNNSESNRKYCKRKALDEDNDGGGFQVPKKPKIYWNTHLHNIFLHAIRQIGVEKAVPKRILEVMNIPHLTRENVASHLQKYRLFLKNVAEKGMVEGLSQRALKSKFAESLPISMIYDIQARFEKQKHSYYINPFNKVVTSLIDQKVSTNNSYVTTHHGRSQFPYYSNLFNQVLQNKSTLGSNIGINNVGNSAMLSTYGGGLGLMTSQKFLSEGSRGNYIFSNVLGNCNIGYMSNSKILPQTSAYNPNNNSSGIQMNDVSLMGSSANNNSSGFINGTQNENINVTSSLGNENFDLLQEGFGSQFDSNVGGGGENELSTTLTMAENKQQVINASSTSEIEVNLMEDDPSELLLMLDDMGLFNDLMEENNLDASDFSNVELLNSANIVQPLYQLEGNDIFAKEGVYDKFTGNIIDSSNTSVAEQDLDMEKIEAFFGTLDD